MKKYQTCNGCKASREEKPPGQEMYVFSCALKYEVGWAGNPLKPCPKPKTLEEYFMLKDNRRKE